MRESQEKEALNQNMGSREEGKAISLVCFSEAPALIRSSNKQTHLSCKKKRRDAGQLGSQVRVPVAPLPLMPPTREEEGEREKSGCGA